MEKREKKLLNIEWSMVFASTKKPKMNAYNRSK